MGRENLKAKARRAATVVDRLAEQMPEAKIELNYARPLELLAAVILSAQCTDKRVNLVTPALFKRFPSALAYARATAAELEPYIQSCGLYRTKAKNLILVGKALVERHGGSVPTTRGELQALPGVGPKTAGVVLIHLGGEPSFPVDTHIRRLARRLGFSTATHPDKVERDLRRLLPSDRWGNSHQLLIWHGRRTCFARAPACDRCGVARLCPKIGVKVRARPATPRAGRTSSASSASE